MLCGSDGCFGFARINDDDVNGTSSDGLMFVQVGDVAEAFVVL